LPSTTAGGFQILAKHFVAVLGTAVKRDGTVVKRDDTAVKAKVAGAAWGGDDNLRVEHILVDNLDDLPKLYKSKYVQSYMADIYRQTKSELEIGTQILFSGTPCQIAGLYAFLGKDYPNLFTVDILCHSAPPSGVFRRYLDETFGKRNVASYEFRYKEPNDRSFDVYKVKVQLKDSTTIVRRMFSDDVFGKLFLRGYLMPQHCEHCRFAAFPRQGDITLGDFWKIEAFDRHFTGGLAGCVLVNSKKGGELAKIIQDSAAKWKRKSTSWLLGNLGIWLHRQANKQRERFFQYARIMPVTKAARYVFKKHYEIGVVGLPRNRNYGGGLTYFALYHTLLELGKAPLMIELPRNSLIHRLCYLRSGNRSGNKSGFKHFPYQRWDMAKRFNDRTAMRKLNDVCDMFLVGSDQLFGSSGMYETCSRFASLDWGEDRKKKSAFAASFGSDELTCSDKERAVMAYHLKKFDYFSVREQSGVELCRREFGIEAKHVLDPVFLCRKEHYDALVKNGHETLLGITVYLRSKNPEKQSIVNDIAAATALPVLQIDEYDDYHNKNEAPFIEDWLAAVAGAKLVVTDSFHGLCFAVIYQKPFIAVCERGGQYTHSTRLESLLSLLGLQDRLVFNRQDYERLRNKLDDIDWTSVNEKLEAAKRESFAALEQAVAPLEQKKPMSESDMRRQPHWQDWLLVRWFKARYFYDVVPLVVHSDGTPRFGAPLLHFCRSYGMKLLFRAEWIMLSVKRLFRR
jgi:coenzyme F420-reducing hydrogenase beta subunit